MARGIVEEFRALKADAEADVLAMQVGDFYEFFGEDAELVGDELDLKVSQKAAGGTTHPMAGVPVDELTPYLKALVERGYRVAVADQRETDDGHVREVSRVVTPGTLLETSGAAARYLAAVARVDGRYGLAFADVTTGRFLATGVGDGDAAAAELARFAPTEVLPGPDLRSDDDALDRLREATDATLTLHEAAAFGPGRARHALRERFGDAALDSLGLDDEAAVAAAGAALAYVEATNDAVAAAMTRLQPFDGSDHVALDATTQRNLELVETMRGESEGSLFDTVDHTVTSGGRRRLREWLTRPSRLPDEIGERHDGVEAFAAAALARDRVRDLLADGRDLERLASRAASGSADAADLLAVRDTLAVLPGLRDAVAGTPLADSPVAALLEAPDGDAAADLRDRVDEALVDDQPSTTAAGGRFARGYDAELDEIAARHERARSWIDDLPEREKARTGITHLTVDRNKTDGYYIQVGKSETDRVPDEYREIKTLKNSRRYVTDDLEAREREVLRLEEARAERERELFAALRETVADRAELLREVGRVLAEVDALAALATHAVEHDWTRPTVEPGASGLLAVEAGRHPVVERTTDFVPNDLRLDDGRRFLLVTGPNMSGKSTYMRQAALVVLLAQAGSFVPAEAARVGPVDAIYTRVGALDELARGRSTFMVEMAELSNILHRATDESLVVLDEVGRGTATYDGISIAWAATEYLSPARSAAPTPSVLFATHYHELTELADRVEGVANVHMAVAGEDGATEGGDASRPTDERGEEVTFLRTVRPGPADRSYGIHVAELAGVPDPVVDRAREVLRRLREDEAIDVRGDTGDAGGTEQVVFDLGSGGFRSASADGGDATDGDRTAERGDDAAADADGATDGSLDPATAAVLDELRDTSVDETPPVDLMAKVQEWQERLGEE
ncbi:MAG: DNA mismatch repair protein MutS [Haloferacaceae archaeon]